MKINKKSYFLLFLIFLVQIFAVVQWALCGGFADPFRFSSFDLELRLIEGIHNDVGVSLLQVRGFHNKLIGSGFDVFGSYLRFWDPVFLTGLFSFAGFVGIILGWYYFLARKKHVFTWVLFALVVLIPFVEMFSLLRSFPWPVRVVVLSLPYLFWSVFGYVRFLSEKKVGMRWIVLLLVVSLWYHFAQSLIGKICVS